MTKVPRILALMGGAALYGQERCNIEVLAVLQEEGCVVHCLISDEPWSQSMAPALDSCRLAWTRVSFVQNYQTGSRILHVCRSALKFLRGNFQFIRMIAKLKPTHIHAPNAMYVLSFALGLSLIPVPLVFNSGD